MERAQSAEAPVPLARRVTGDQAALRAACEPSVGLCTIVGIEGSFSRRLGAQLAVGADGTIVGSLADGCLERQLASEVRQAASSGGGPVVRRFGSGSGLIDFRLPCGSGLDILIDPAPDRAACRRAVEQLDERRPAILPLLVPEGLLAERRYMPDLRLLMFGEGPEVEALRILALAAGLSVEGGGTQDAGLSLGQAPEGVDADEWTAIVLLFHDHEWEQAILRWALATAAFFIGAQGGEKARELRLEGLASSGLAPEELARVRSPVGVIARSREPGVLALSVLAEIVGEYEALHPHG